MQPPGLTHKQSLEQRLGSLTPEQREAFRKLQAQSRQRPSPSGPAAPLTAPVSAAQRRLWFLDQLVPNSPSYNIDLTLRFEFPPGESLHLPAMTQALALLVHRHESLRSTFTASEGEPLQCIHPAFSPALPVFNLSELPNEARQSEIVRLATQEAQTPFDLSRLPLLRTVLLQLSDSSYILLLTVHHIIADGWSLQIFFSELTHLYHALRHNQPPTLPPLATTFSAYTRWQHAWLRSPEAAQQLNYWKSKLHNAPPLSLPTDFPRPPIATLRGARQLIAISQSVARRLESLSRRENVTLYAVLLAAFQVLLHRYSGQTDLVIGTPVLGRSRADTEHLIGCFLNTVVLRTDLAGNPSFLQLLPRTQETLIEALARQEIPFERIVDELQVPRDLSRNPLFQISFQLFQGLRKGNRESQPLVAQKGTTQLDIAIDLFHNEEGLSGSIEYSTDLFDDSTIERFLGHFRVLLESIAENPNQNISALPLLTHAERRTLLDVWSSRLTPPAPFESLPHLLHRQFQTHPNAIALETDSDSWTYQRLSHACQRFATHLSTLPLAPNQLIALETDRSPEAIAAMLGAFFAGRAVLFLDPHLPKSRRDFILNDARPAATFTQTHLALLEAFDSTPDTHSLPPTPAPIHPEALAYLIYTSGSTGAPKAVAIPHRALSNHMLWWQESFPLCPGEKMLHKYSLSFDVAFLEILAPLLAGATLVIARPGGQLDSHYLANQIHNRNISAIDTVPGQLQALLDEPAFLTAPALRRITCGGEPLPKELAERCLARLPHVPLFNVYGPSETTISSTAWACHPSPFSRGIAIGRPIRNTEVYVLDPSLQPAPIGVPGELFIGGDGLALGYWRRPELTLEKFIPHPFSTQPGHRLYRTGDRARFRSDGNLEHLGRADAQIKIRGYRIELGEIESVLSQHPQVRACAVTPTASGSLAAHVVPSFHPELWPSLGEYPIYDSLLYRALTSDEHRNNAYRRALASTVRGKTIVEIGTGEEAFLARLCIEAGAKRVYAIEVLKEAFDRASTLVHQLGLSQQIRLIFGDSRSVSLPEPADVCVSEILGTIASSEGAPAILRDARRFLKPGGAMIPARCATQIAAVSLPESIRNSPRFTDLSAPYVDRLFTHTQRPFDVRVCIRHLPHPNLLSSSECFESFDFSTPPNPEGQRSLTLQVQRPGEFDGFLLWIQLETLPGLVLDALAEPTNWLPVFLPAFSPPVPLAPGDKIHLTLATSLAQDGVHPDYFVQGHIERPGQPDLPFEISSPWDNPAFKAHPFYAALFADGYQNRTVPPSGQIDRRELESFLRNRLPEHMVPSVFLPIDRLPSLPSGKIDRAKLPEPDHSQRPPTGLPPRTPTERTLAQVWKELLQVEHLGIDDNFFEKGGHSLLAVQMVQRLRSHHQLSVAVASIFQFPTIRKLADSLNSEGASP